MTNGSQAYEFINMNVGTLTGGPGFIGGNVALGANKGANSGVQGLTIYLLNNTTKQIVQMASTDANGNYSFGNFPTGSYSVYPELLNYSTLPAPVQITGGSSNVTGINFYQDDAKMSIRPVPAAVAGMASRRSTWTVAPNPASGEATITLQGSADKVSSIVLTDIAGKVIMNIRIAAMQQGRQAIDLHALTPGLYFLQGTGLLSGTVQKLLVR